MNDNCRFDSWIALKVQEEMENNTGEEIVVEYNHNDYIDLVGPLRSHLVKSVPTASLTSLPKKPGNIPPFALYLQEQRNKMMADHPHISFGEVGKRMGELWKSLEVNRTIPTPNSCDI